MSKREPKSAIVLFILPMLLALFSISCNLPGMLSRGGEEEAAPVGQRPMRTPLPTFTPTPAGQNFMAIDPGAGQSAGLDDAAAEGNFAFTPAPAQAIPTSEPDDSTPTPTLVVQPTPTPDEPSPTPTPDGVQAVVQQNMNVRQGPGTNYPIVGSATNGDTSKVVGRNNDSSWVQVEFLVDGGKAWVYAGLLNITGDVSAVPVAQAPPPPAPVAQAPPPQEQQPPPEEAAPPPPPEKKYQFTPGAWHASGNAGIVHFKGRIHDEHGNLINGFSVLLDNWSWKVLSHPAGASHWYPEKGPGEWDVVMPDLGSAQGWWWLSVVSYDCDFFSAFDSLCSQYTQLSEEVKIEVSTPDESIINADWVCHWDCDKGVYTRSYVRDEGYVGP